MNSFEDWVFIRSYSIQTIFFPSAKAYTSEREYVYGMGIYASDVRM